MSTKIGQSIYQLGYEISPIILSGGIANFMPGSLLPIVAVTEAANFGVSLLNGINPISLDNFLCHFRPLPGGTLVDNDLAMYPFLNQYYAANAIIAKPLKISLLMNCPAKNSGAYITKMITFTALKAVLDQHQRLGGTYIVATPSYIYLNCLLVNLSDVSRPDSNQPQNAWQWDFVQPLIATGAQNTLSALMNTISNALPSSASGT